MGKVPTEFDPSLEGAAISGGGAYTDRTNR